MNHIHNHIIYHLFLCLMLSLFISCGKTKDCITSTGKIITEDRSIGFYNGIHVSDNVEIHLTNDASNIIQVRAGKNIIDNIKTEVKGGILYITNENTCNWVRSYKKDIIVYAGISNADFVYHYGSADINSDLLQKDNIFFHHYGNGNVSLHCNSKRIWMDMDQLGDFTLEGKVNTLIARSYNLGQLKASGLNADTIWIINSGQGNCYVNAGNVLGATIENEGNIYYYGNPGVIDEKRNSSGKLIPIN